MAGLTDLPEEARRSLAALTPATYIGNAAAQVGMRIFDGELSLIDRVFILSAAHAHDLHRQRSRGGRTNCRC